MAYALIDHSFLNDKMKRTYKRVIEERKTRFIRQSEKIDITPNYLSTIRKSITFESKK